MAETDVIPAVVEQEWDKFAAKVALAASYARWIHINLSDGTMGTETTLTDMSRLPELTRQYPDVSFEVHLLTANPEKYVRQMADSGITRIIAHVESNDPRRFLDEAKFDEVEVGLALDGATEVEQIEPFLEEVDFVVVMTAEAGVVGGTFLPEALEKIRLIRQNYPDLPIEVVGGITDQTVKPVKDAGATRIVSADYVFRSPETVGEAMQTLQEA